MCNNRNFIVARKLAVSVKSVDRTNSTDPDVYINEKKNKSSLRHRASF